MHTWDTVDWRGNDAALDMVVKGTEAIEHFDMTDWGFRDSCGTSGCMWGSFVLQCEQEDRLSEFGLRRSPTNRLSPFLTVPGEYRGLSLLEVYGSVAEVMGISVSEAIWLFSDVFYPPEFLVDEVQEIYIEGRIRPRDKEPNLNRLKKYLAWKRRKKDRQELDVAMQEADRRLLRAQQRRAREAAV